eukprot:scaffold1596_cov302-Pinguiococcus_pyrenoidosus.AAC.12
MRESPCSQMIGKTILQALWTCSPSRGRHGAQERHRTPGQPRQIRNGSSQSKTSPGDHQFVGSDSAQQASEDAIGTLRMRIVHEAHSSEAMIVPLNRLRVHVLPVPIRPLGLVSLRVLPLFLHGSIFVLDPSPPSSLAPLLDPASVPSHNRHSVSSREFPSVVPSPPETYVVIRRNDSFDSAFLSSSSASDPDSLAANASPNCCRISCFNLAA